MKTITLTGVTPSGTPHIGNYIGAIKNFVDLQNQEGNQCIYCVVDLHAITVWQDPKVLANKTREVTAAFIASGIDPKKNNIFSKGGRVLNLVSVDKNLSKARFKAISYLNKINWKKGFFRKDIGWRVIKKNNEDNRR